MNQREVHVQASLLVHSSNIDCIFSYIKELNLPIIIIMGKTCGIIYMNWVKVQIGTS